MKFSIKDFSSRCDQIGSFLRIWLHLLEKSLMENFIFIFIISSSLCSAIYLSTTTHKRTSKIKHHKIKNLDNERGLGKKERTLFSHTFCSILKEIKVSCKRRPLTKKQSIYRILTFKKIQGKRIYWKTKPHWRKYNCN